MSTKMNWRNTGILTLGYYGRNGRSFFCAIDALEIHFSGGRGSATTNVGNVRNSAKRGCP